MKQVYFYHFKLNYFKALLREGFYHSVELDKLLKIDNSIAFTEPIFPMEDYAVIDSLVKLDHKEMLQDSVRRINAAEGAQGKMVFAYALKKYHSKWLDSLVKVRYRLWQSSMH